MFLSFIVIQNLILQGRTTDAIEKTKELFPNLLNNSNLLFVLKVRQFIEMINGTESEISNISLSIQTINSSLNHHDCHQKLDKIVLLPQMSTFQVLFAHQLYQFYSSLQYLL